MILAATGCAYRDDDERAVRATFQTLRHAYLQQDYGTVCDLLSPRARREVGELGHERPAGCKPDLERNLSAAIVSARDRVDPPIQSTTVDGREATVTALLGGSTAATIHFVELNGEWKLDKLYGTTAPPRPDLR